MVLIPFLAAAILGVQGQVKLPLEEYLSLIERAESVERARVDSGLDVEAVVSELVSQQTSITWAEGADVSATYEVELRGTPTRPIVLPVSGLVYRSSVSPEGDASLQADASGLRFVAPAPGRYRVNVDSRAAIETENGVGRLALAPFRAPVGEYTLTLPEEFTFVCEGSVIAAQTVEAGQRTIRFAVPRGDGAVVEARRDLVADETVLAKADIVTTVALGVDGPIRSDYLLYEVSRGEMQSFAITLPSGLNVERASTDEGEAAVVLDGDILTIERETKLSGTGFVKVFSRLDGDQTTTPLAALSPAVPVGARFLALQTAVAADVSPLPADRWLRVDLEDLPAAARAKEMVAAWRLEGEGAAPTLQVNRRPAAPFLPTVVVKRETLSLLTADGSLVHRDRLHVRSDASAFRVRFSPGTTLWSVQVNDLQVRPISRGGDTLVPLSFGSDEAEVVEVIAVRDQALPGKRSQLALALPETDAPVLTHTWRVLLPEGNLYRWVDGSLTPVVVENAPQGGSRFAVEPSGRAIGRGGSASISGRVFDPTGHILPGATVSLHDYDTGWSGVVIADRNGAFSFVALRKGTYNLVAELSGFAPTNYEQLELRSSETASYALTLDIASVAETIAVTGPPPALSAFAEAALPTEEEAGFDAEAAELKKGLVSGVKPVPVVIPESGKMITLTGVMPVARVHVALDVKPK